jgi:hypothetical protein
MQIGSTFVNGNSEQSIQTIETKTNKTKTKNKKKDETPHHYCEGARVLCRVDSMSKYSENPYDGPNTIVQVNTNGTVRLKMGAVIDTGNIRLLKPYRD